MPKFNSTKLGKLTYRPISMTVKFPSINNKGFSLGLFFSPGQFGHRQFYLTALRIYFAKSWQLLANENPALCLCVRRRSVTQCDCECELCVFSG